MTSLRATASLSLFLPLLFAACGGEEFPRELPEPDAPAESLADVLAGRPPTPALAEQLQDLLAENTARLNDLAEQVAAGTLTPDDADENYAAWKTSAAGEAGLTPDQLGLLLLGAAGGRYR